MEDLAPFRDPVKASNEAGQEDIKGGKGEPRVNTVWRKIRCQFVVV